MIGAMMENGPYHLSSTPSSPSIPFSLSLNPFSWHHLTHLLYIDQPIGTGYSQSMTPGLDLLEKNETTLAQHLVNALVHLLTDPQSPHRDLAESQLYITGES